MYNYYARSTLEWCEEIWSGRKAFKAELGGQKRFDFAADSTHIRTPLNLSF